MDELEYFNEEETADYMRGKLAKKLILDYAEQNNAYNQVRKALQSTIDLTTKEMHTKREIYILRQG